MKDKKTAFGRDYFLEALPLEKDVKPVRTGDVKVDADMLERLKLLGLINNSKQDD
tara:strand:- start:655 stop:819 length:165 start_codon:yes stop_codon:yes gene_type:complete